MDNHNTWLNLFESFHHLNHEPMNLDLQNSSRERRRTFAVRVNESTPEIVEQIARDFGCLRLNGNGQLKGACGVMLDRIASGALKVVATDKNA